MMNRISYTFFFLMIVILSGTAQSKKVNPLKNAVVKSTAAHQQELIKLSDEIWAYAETALKENKSSKALADYAEAQGFRVKRGVSQMPTAFVAEFGEGKPIIGIMGEFDA